MKYVEIRKNRIIDNYCFYSAERLEHTSRSSHTCMPNIERHINRDSKCLRIRPEMTTWNPVIEKLVRFKLLIIGTLVRFIKPKQKRENTIN